MRSLILDTGPLIALLARNEKWHDWVVDRLSGVQAPVITCEAVIAEAVFLLWRDGRDHGDMLRMVERGALRLAFSLADQVRPVARMMRQYADLPMSLADACLVRMAELHEGSAILTLDQHFRIYRTADRRVLNLIMPKEKP